MPIVNRVSAFADDIVAWRHDFHENPEILYEVHRTAAIVADKLKAFGVDEVVTGIGRTGVVGVIRGRQSASGKVIGLRADMDALPIQEIVERPHKSKIPGKMHACGHDGHTAMLLGAARYLSETRNFDGTAIVIFQPAEEGGGGGKAMIEDGLMTRWKIDEVYGMHNMPGVPVGTFAMRTGPTMAAADRFVIDIEGRGGHAAMPNQTIDTIIVAMTIGQALQSIVARNVDPVESAVLSITTFHAGDAFNVIPQTARITGTVRTFKNDVRDLVEKRMSDIITGIAASMGAKASLDYERGYPPTVNHADQTSFAAKVAMDVVGADKVTIDHPPLMGAEDFAYMLEERPGAYIFVGNGDTPVCHHPAYDFDDNAVPFGASFWARLVEMALPAR